MNNTTFFNVLLPIMMVSAGAWLIGILRYKRHFTEHHPDAYRRLGILPKMTQRYWSPSDIRAFIRHIRFIASGRWRSLNDSHFSRLCARLRVILFIAFPLCFGGVLYAFLPVIYGPPSTHTAVSPSAPLSDTEKAAVYLNDGYRLWKEGDFEAALNNYDEAAALTPEDGQVYYYRGIALADAGYIEDAKNDFILVTELDPENFDAHLRLDRLYTAEKDWNAVIRLWTDFLYYNPDHARAIMERAGAYHHSGNESAAVADLKSACDLGDKVGCRYYKKYGP
jgi:tetratricopeptide (TPR) repeat protein